VLEVAGGRRPQRRPCLPVRDAAHSAVALADVVLGTTKAPTGFYVNRGRVARCSKEAYAPQGGGELWADVERFTAAYDAAGDDAPAGHPA
jgi:hypothetical protein